MPDVNYRRRWGTTIWHWSPKCATWPPALEAEERSTNPKSGELCNECRVLDPNHEGAGRA